MKLSAPSQLVERHRETIGSDLLIVNPPADSLAHDLVGGHGQLLNQRYGDYSYHHERLPDRSNFAVLPPTERNHRAALVYLDREKALLDLNLAAAAASLQPGGQLWLVGENRSGARSAGRRLDAVTTQWEKIDAARHCSLYRGEVAPGLAAPALDEWTREFALDNGQVVCSLPGVFAHGSVDPATRMLIDHLPELHGDILDYGCGAGIIGLAALARGAVRTTLLDHSALALESARLTFARNGQPAPTLVPADGLSGVTGPFDAILSNPPFHRGVNTDYRAAQELLDGGIDLLRPGGLMIVVANAFLDYGQRLKTRFGNCAILAEDRRFRVYCSRR